MNKFGEHIHRLRKEQNLTLLTLAERVGIDAAVLSKIENGHRVPNEQMLTKLAVGLAAKEDELSNLLICDEICQKLYQVPDPLKVLKMAEAEMTYEKKTFTHQMNFIQSSLANVMAEHKAVLKAWIFGSYARGTQNKKSDLDVMVKLDNRYKWSMFDLIQLSFELSQKLRVKVDLVEWGHVKEFAQASVEKEKIEVYVQKK
jgi:predicted nucleotidyltransferase/DNA-binding XRE family transcriptional regulator